MELEDGDIKLTGTHRGVGQVQAGDRFVGGIKSDGQILVSQEWQTE
jgi:2-keto-4-pentenoate hydratase/2-oxohepta-3-ene-1,7-dioic acid hydratase in catechol pathway